MNEQAGRVLTVNVGQPRMITWLGQTEPTSIWKSPVEGRLAVRGVNVDGDDQADRSVHGGPEKAVYSYAREDEDWWEQHLGRTLGPGTFGENLTLEGVDVTNAVIGEHWAIGTAVFEVCQPRVPCWKLGAKMNDPHFQQVFTAARRPGAYLRIVQEGEIGAGDAVQIVHRPETMLTVRDVVNIYNTEHDRASELLQVPQLAATWVKWAKNRLKYSTTK